MVDELAGGDRHMLCSAGLSDLVANGEIQATLLSRPLARICGELLRLVLDQENRNNIAVVAAEVQEDAPHRRAV